jgi:cytochrome P450
MAPDNPIAAVVHADPYPYYAALARTRPLYRDDGLGLWVASGAEAVTAVLTNPLCRVRPPAEPVPKALLGSAAGDVFRHLVRMNDGPGRCPLKRATSDVLGSIEPEAIERESRRCADILAPRPDTLTRFQFDLPVHVVGSLLGLPADALPMVALRVGAFVRCLAPAAQPDEIAAGKAAAQELLALFRSIGGGGLLATLAREAKRNGIEDADAVAANGIGFLFQAYEATAGLIGNTLLALARDAALREAIADDPNALRTVVDEVVRFDPPVQNTRRWVAEAGTVAGRAMAANDTILVVLAAANRDPAANPDPDRFDISRRDRRSFTFCVGAHACPGERIATAIATAGVARLVASGCGSALATGPVSYRASANTRIPLL